MRRLVAAATLLLAACDTTGAYVYYARSYDVDRDCLAATEALDVLAGADPGLGCSPRCLAVKDPDGGAALLYGTTACGPTPFGADATEKDLRCPDVLSALRSTRICTPDSGLRDSGSDAPDAEPGDAASDGPAE